MNAPTRLRVQPCPLCKLSSTDPGELWSRDGRSHTSPGVVVDLSGCWVCLRCGSLGNADDLGQLGTRAIKLDPNRPPDLIPANADETWASTHALAYVDPAVWGFLDDLDLDPKALPDDVARWLRPGHWLPPSYVTPRGVSWAEAGCRLVLPARDLRGELRHLVAMRMDPRKPSVVLHADVDPSALVVCCSLARRLLEGSTRPPAEVLVATTPLAMLQYLSHPGDADPLPVLAPVAPLPLEPDDLGAHFSNLLARRFGAGRVQVAAIVADVGHLEAA